jgi:hypothetical protein
MPAVLDGQLKRQLCFLANCWSDTRREQCMLHYDFAPHSFSFAKFILSADAKAGERSSRTTAA